MDSYLSAVPHVKAAVQEIEKRFNLVGGSYPGHGEDPPGAKYAADFWSTSKAKHDQVLAWVRDNAKRLGVKYIITWKRIWSVARASEGVRPYTRYGTSGTASQLHTNHVHISFNADPPKEQEDMPLTNDDIDRIWDRVTVENVWGVGDNPKVQADSALRLIGRDARDAKDGLAEVRAQLAEILKRLPAPASLDDSEGIE